MSGCHMGRAVSTLASTSGHIHLPSLEHIPGIGRFAGQHGASTSCCSIPGARTGYSQRLDANVWLLHTLPTLAIVYLFNFGHMRG